MKSVAILLSLLLVVVLIPLSQQYQEYTTQEALTECASCLQTDN